MHVLIVEDTLDSAELMQSIFSHHQISHSVAYSAEDALKALEIERPTLILVDLALPGMSGWELLAILRQRPDTAQLPIVALTAYHSTRVAEEAIQAGFNAYFPKPIAASRFVEELRRIIGG
jgi:CheY-like chemotaxis protein